MIIIIIVAIYHHVVIIIAIDSVIINVIVIIHIELVIRWKGGVFWVELLLFENEIIVKELEYIFIASHFECRLIFKIENGDIYMGLRKKNFYTFFGIW